MIQLTGAGKRHGPRDRGSRALGVTTCLALLSGAAAVALPWLFSTGYRWELAIGCSLALTAAWLILTVFAVVRWRWRAAWTLFGLPMALYLPVGIVFVILACTRGQACL